MKPRAKTAERREIAIYGAGGFAREVAWLAQNCRETGKVYEIVCFIDDALDKIGKTLNGIPVLDWDMARRSFPKAGIVVAIGSPRVREGIVARVAQAGYGFETLIHPRVEKSDGVEMPPGTVVCAGTILTTNIRLGVHVQVNLSCTVGHDVILGDFTTLAPGVHVSGWVHFGKRVYVGTGAVIINGTEESPLTIGEDVVIGAAACVTRSIPAGVTVAGVPAKSLPDSKGKMIRREYGKNLSFSSPS